jgi:APA family basic amino acid/polyamine antiporter
VNSLFRTKSVADLVAASENPESRLAKSLGPWSLIALGLGAVIGSGIFVLSGTAAAGEVMSFESVRHAPVLDLILNGPDAISTIGRPGAGPAISLSFLITAIVCAFSALCFAELASTIPVSGSAYTYTYATLGELVAWIIGWDLILEYAVSNMAVAVGFSAYLADVFDSVFGIHLPRELTTPMFAGGQATGAWFNLPAFIVLMVLTWLLVRGVRESARTNNIMVLVKVGAVLAFIIGAASAVDASNWTPYMPNGFSGVITGAAIVFFTYIGFDSVSTASEECRNPQRDVPMGIIGTLLICTVLYIGVAVVLTGIVDYQTLSNAAPVANALKEIGLDNVRRIVSVGALIGMVSSLLVFQYGQARVWFAMSRDRLMPSSFSKVHPVHKTPHVSTWVAGLFVAIPAGIWDIGTFADLSSIGTLFAFALVSAGVLVLRKRDPHLPRKFRVPFVPVVPVLSIVFCVILMAGLPLEAWIRFAVWLVIGLVIYFTFGRKHSALAEK